MYKLFFPILFCIFCCCRLQAATVAPDSAATQITVTDEYKEPLAYATVMFVNGEGDIAKSGTTDENGKIKMDGGGDNGYKIVIRYVGYKPVTLSAPFPKTVQMQPKDNVLEKVVVKAKKSIYKTSDGTFEINPAEAGLQDQPDVAGMIAFLPGMLDVGGTPVPVTGGTPLYVLDGIEQKSYDRISALRPEQVKKVSVNFYPSAKYSAKYSCIISVTTNQRAADYLCIGC